MSNSNKNIFFNDNRTSLSSRQNFASNSLVQRKTTITGSKFSEILPILEPEFKEKCIERLLNFLISESYNSNLSKKFLSNPSRAEFVNIFSFCLEKLFDDFIMPQNITDEFILKTFSDLKYPGIIKKNHLISVGAPNSWNYLLAGLLWLSEEVSYFNYYKEKIGFNFFGSLNDDERNFKEFVINIFKNPENFLEEKEKYNKSIEIENKNKNNELNQIVNKIKQVQSEINKQETFSKKKENFEKEFENLKQLLNENKKTLNINNLKIKELNEEIQRKKIFMEKNNDSINLLKNKEKELENQIKIQKISYEEINKIQEKKELLLFQLKNQNHSNTEILNKINDFKEKINKQKKDILQIQILDTKEKYNIENIKIDYFLNKCENKNFNFDFIKNDFNVYKKYIQNNLIENRKILDEKENIKNQINQNLNDLENEISNIEIEITQKQNELNQKNEEIKNISQNGTNKIKKLDENFKKLQNDIQKINENIYKKENEISQLKILENNEQQIYTEIEKDSYEQMQKMEEEYKQTINDIMNIKQENIDSLKNYYQYLDKIYEDLNNNLEEE